MSIWDDAKRNLVEWYTVTADKTTELTKITALRYDKFGLSRDIERQFSELGSLVYHGVKEGREGLLETPEATGLLERITQLEKELRAKEEEIARVRREHASRKAAEAAAGGDQSEKILADPALEAGGADSAILMDSEADAPSGTGEAREDEQDEQDAPEKGS